MPEITDPEAIRFVNEVVRPLSEQIRALKAQIDDAMATWFLGVNAKFAQGADIIEDGREAQGVSRLVADDVSGFMYMLSRLQAELNAEGMPARVQKPCVRPLRVG